MNVLHVTLSFSPGGRREAIGSLAQGLAERGVASHLCCLDDYGCDADARDRLFAGSINLQRQRLFDVTALRQLRRYCFDHRIDILHAHDAASEASCALALPLDRIPLLMTFHRTRNIEEAQRHDRLRNALAGLRVGAVVTASQARLRYYVRRNYIHQRKVICVPLGIDLTRFRPQPRRRKALRNTLGLGDDVLVVGAAGHFGPDKGIDIAIDAFQIMCRAQADIKAVLVILGRGQPEQEKYVRARIDPELAARIHLVGFQAQPEQWFQSFDVFLHAARDEAFGLVLAEAMACGAPVVAGAVGGIPEVVADGETGRLVYDANAATLADALTPLLTDPAMRARMSAAGIKRTQDIFNQKRYAQQMHDLYWALAQRQPPTVQQAHADSA